MYLRSQNRLASGVQNRRPNERSKTRPKHVRRRTDHGPTQVLRCPISWAFCTLRLTETVRDGHSSSRWAKVRSKTRPGRRCTRSHFRKAGISLNGIWIPNFPKRSEAAQNRRKPNETGNFRGNGRPKKNRPKSRSKTTLKAESKIAQNGAQKSAQNTPKIHESLMPALLKRKTVYLRSCTKLRKSFIGERGARFARIRFI
jgi:hypothetical protein